MPASSRTILAVSVGDRVRLRKPHPCGASQWLVTRVGMDIGLQCIQCQGRALLSRAQFERRVHSFLSKASDAASESI